MPCTRLMRYVIAVSAALPFCSGCRSVSHAEQKIQAEQQWNNVRARVKYQLAEQQYTGRLFDEAIQTVQESLALNPAQEDAYVLLARANLEQDRPASAQAAVQAAVSAGLNSAELLYIQGMIYEQRDQLPQALEQFARASAIDPGSADYLAAQAECLVALDRPNEALHLLDRHADQVNEDGTLAVLSARVALLLGNRDDVIRRYRSSVLPSNATDTLREELGLLLVRAGRYDEAFAPLLSIYLTNGEGSGAAQRGLAACHLARNDPARAVELLSDYVQNNPKDTAALVMLATAAIATGDLANASHALERAEQSSPPRAEIDLLRALIAWRQGDLDTAALSLNRILDADPRDLEAHCLMAELLLSQKHYEGARSHFEHALLINPDCDWAKRGLLLTG